MRASARRLTPQLRAALRALRGFLAGFTGMPAARLPGSCPNAAREALSDRSARRPTCC
jgi:hypothetical protein